MAPDPKRTNSLKYDVLANRQTGPYDEFSATLTTAKTRICTIAKSIGASFASYVKNANWAKDGLRPYYAYRDLGIKAAAEGKVLADIVRADQPCAGSMGYHSHDLEFQMAYLLKDWARLYFEDIGEIRGDEGDASCQSPGIKHEVLECSDDFEAIEITMPAEFDTHTEHRES